MPYNLVAWLYFQVPDQQKDQHDAADLEVDQMCSLQTSVASAHVVEAMVVEPDKYRDAVELEDLVDYEDQCVVGQVGSQGPDLVKEASEEVPVDADRQ